MEHLIHDLRSQAHGGLVEQHHARVAHQRAADGAHLLLAARGVGRLACAPGLEAREVVVDLLQIGGNLALVGARVAAREQVLLDRQVGKAVAPFHDLYHATLDEFGRREVGDLLALQCDAALGDFTAFTLEQIGDGTQRGGLARAIAAQQGHDALVRHLQRRP